MRSKNISGVLYGSRLVDQPHVRPEVETLTKFVDAPKVYVEVGFDHGFRLFDMAQRNPRWQLVGLEVRRKRVEAMTQRAEEFGLKNLLVWRMDARTVFGCVLPSKSVDCVHILYPTPWWDPKKRQKRLLINQEFLASVRDCLRADGVIRIETDVGDYARRIEQATRDTPGLTTIDVASGSSYEPKCEELSRRERKSVRDGLQIFRFCLRLEPASQSTCART